MGKEESRKEIFMECLEEKRDLEGSVEVAMKRTRGGRDGFSMKFSRT